MHCVIIGFSYEMTNPNISPYLIEAPTVFITSRKTSICEVPDLVFGNMPNDDGSLIIEVHEYTNFIYREPKANKFIKRFLGATEFINNRLRYCLWLVDASPSELRSTPVVMERVNKCQQIRQASTREATRRLADTPTLFGEIRHPNSEYILIPRHSSENRKYIPMGFVSSDIIAGDSNMIISNATLYHFGILTSNVHMAWTRAVCGRLKSDYRYSKDIIYNNFPWPEATTEQTTTIEKLAQAILDARANYPNSSLADLYDPIVMPPDLLKAHQNLDRAVMKLYGFPSKGFTEADCVAALMEIYQKLCSEKENLR